MNVDIEILKGEKILVGVSGGADSMCLLHLLSEKRKSVPFSLYVCHVNHMIRGSEAERDQEVVRKFSEKLGAEFILKKVDAVKFSKENGLTLEQGARILRYDAFDEVRKELKIDKLFLAHNKGDQAETVFMHIARGSSLAGAKGMSEKGGFIFRPLLNTSREEILAYNKKNKIEFVSDSTNEDNSYARNFVRNEVFPLIKKKYPNIEDALVKFSKLCAKDDEYIEKNLDKSLVKTRGDEAKILNGAALLDESLSARLVRLALRSIQMFADFNEVHISKILELFKKKSGAKINLPHGVSAHRDYDGVTLAKESASVFLSDEVKFEGKSLKIGEKEIVVENLRGASSFEKGKLYLDKNRIPKDAVIRHMKEGDEFKKLGASGKKKLCDYLTDKKIEKRKREELLFLASGKTILACLGLDVSDAVKIDQTTKDIISIYYK